MNSFKDSSEWQWLFQNGLKWDEILKAYHPEFPTVEGWTDAHEAKVFLREMLDVIDQWGQEKIAKRAAKLDAVGPGTVEKGEMLVGPLLQELYCEARDLHLLGMAAKREYGGLELPVAMTMLAFVSISRFCLASSSQLNFFPSMTDMLERFCSKADCERLIPRIINGEISGSMALTEADAGSDIGALKTTAIEQADGSYKIRGSKIFITNGGGGFSFVLARIQGAPEGVNGISLFLLEQFIGDGDNKRMNYSVTKHEHKMGMRGSFTCEVLFEDSIGKLVGEQHRGLALMFHLMNKSRIGAGGQALGLMEACLDYVKKYAEERKQFGKNLLELPLYARNFGQWQVECDAYRAFFVDSLNSFTLYHRLDLKKRTTGDLNQQEQQKLKEVMRVVRLRTPLLKYYGTETCVDISKKAIQALGGHGLIDEHAVGRLHRDSFGPLLYEGTSQIQSLMVLKDLLKGIFKRPGEYFAGLLSGAPAVTSKIGQDATQKEYLKLDFMMKRGLAKLVLKTLRPDEILKIFDRKIWMSQDKVEKLMIHSETICQMMAYSETLKVLSEHSNLDEKRAGLFWDYHRLVHPRLIAILDDWKRW